MTETEKTFSRESLLEVINCLPLAISVIDKNRRVALVNKSTTRFVNKNDIMSVANRMAVQGPPATFNSPLFDLVIVTPDGREITCFNGLTLSPHMALGRCAAQPLPRRPYHTEPSELDGGPFFRTTHPCPPGRQGRSGGTHPCPAVQKSHRRLSPGIPPASEAENRQSPP